MDIIEKLQWRYATKEFDVSKKISKEKIDNLLKAANLTATSYGLQPARVVLVENKETRKKLVKHSWNQKQIIEASHLIVITILDDVGNKEVDKYIEIMSKRRQQPVESLSGFSKMINDFLSKMTKKEKEEWMINQAYIMLGNLLTICAVEGIDSCPIAGFIPEEYDEILNLSQEGQKSVLALPVGYRLENDKYTSLTKVRLDDSEFVIKR